LLGVIRRAIIQDNEPIGAKCLFRNRLECLPDKFPAIKNGDNGNDISLHSLQSAESF
jgi:hypothetical protein